MEEEAPGQPDSLGKKGREMKTLTTMTALLLLSSGASFAQDENIELRFSSWVPPQHAMHTAVKEWSDSISAASNGTITVTLYPSEQLGKANDHYDMARDGIADITYLNVGYQAGRFPIAEAVHIPFMLANADGGSMAFDEWYRPQAATEMSDVKYCLGFAHDPGTFHSKKELRTPDAISGMKIRSGNATIADYVTLLGGTNVRVSAPEARAALESGVADALTFPWESVRLFGIDNVVTHSMDAQLYVSGFAWVMNQGTYDAMSDAQKKVMDDHCTTEWSGVVGRTWGAYERAGRDELAAKDGYTVYELTADELAVWKESAAPIREQWLKNATAAGVADAAASLADFEAKLEARDSRAE